MLTGFVLVLIMFLMPLILLGVTLSYLNIPVFRVLLFCGSWFLSFKLLTKFFSVFRKERC